MAGFDADVGLFIAIH